MNQEKIEINKRLIGKSVRVLGTDYEWVGEVADVKDENTFLVSDGNSLIAVDIFDLRSVD